MLMKTIAAIAVTTLSLACQADNVVKPLDQPTRNNDFYDRYKVAKEVSQREQLKLLPSDVKIVQPGIARVHIKAGDVTVRYGFESQYCSLNEAMGECEERVNRNPSGLVIVSYEGPQRAAQAKR